MPEAPRQKVASTENLDWPVITGPEAANDANVYSMNNFRVQIDDAVPPPRVLAPTPVATYPTGGQPRSLSPEEIAVANELLGDQELKLSDDAITATPTNGVADPFAPSHTQSVTIQAMMNSTRPRNRERVEYSDKTVRPGKALPFGEVDTDIKTATLADTTNEPEPLTETGLRIKLPTERLTPEPTWLGKMLKRIRG